MFIRSEEIVKNDDSIQQYPFFSNILFVYKEHLEWWIYYSQSWHYFYSIYVHWAILSLALSSSFLSSSPSTPLPSPGHWGWLMCYVTFGDNVMHTYLFACWRVSFPYITHVWFHLVPQEIWAQQGLLMLTTLCLLFAWFWKTCFSKYLI